VQTLATIPARRRLAILAMAVAAVCVPADAQQIPDLPAIRVESVYGLQSSPSSFPIARLDDGQTSGDLDRVPAGTLTFAHPLPVRDVLLMLFRGTPFSIVFDPAVGGTFAGELTDLTLRQALEAVLVPAGLDFERRGRLVFVFPRRTETRLFEVSHVDGARVWRRRTSSGEDPAGGVAADLTASIEADFFTELKAGVQSLLSPSGRMHLDRTAGVVQVTDFADRLQQVGIYIETVTLRATRQVRLAARVLDVSLAEQAAIDWAAVAKAAGAVVGPGAGIQVGDLDALVRAIGAHGSVRTIASPQILATNNQPAVMRIGASGAVFSGAPGERTAAGEPARVPAALTLSITPQIGADGIVHMMVSPSYAHQGSGARAVRQVTEADSVMRVRGGDTVVIAGLIREWADAVSAQGLAGVLGRKSEQRHRRELVVLLTPTVVSAGSAPASGAQ
jgi:general secretion pathway protein D